MKPRRAIQEAHERFNINIFLDELNRRHRSNYCVISEPNPPEAIICTGKRTSWVEVTSAFMNRQFAEDVWSEATPGEQHRPMLDEVIISPDAQFSANFVSVVIKKLQKKSYEKFRDRYGPGYLVVSVQYPLFNKRTYSSMRRAWAATASSDLGCFRSIYLIIRQYKGYRVVRWREAKYQYEETAF